MHSVRGRADRLTVKGRISTAAGRIAVCLLFLFFAGCSPRQPAAPAAPTLAVTVPAPVEATLPPTTALPPTTTPAPTSTPTATATATATPRPLVTIAVPPAWTGAAREAAGELAAASWRWQVFTSGDPAAALARGEAQLALVPGTEGIPVGQRPLALAVPYTTVWEATTLAQAEAIRAEGHALVTVLPWAEMDPASRALRIGNLHPTDPDYPLQEPLALQAAAGYEDAATLLAPAMASSHQPENDGVVLMAAVGDVMLDRALGRAIANGRPDYPFALFAPLLQGADVTVGNLESALGDSGAPAEKAYTFRAPPAAADALAEAGFDLVTLANNHALDYGPDALLEGIARLQEAGVQTVGAGANAEAARAPALWEGEGMTLAFLGYVQVSVEGRPPYFDTQSWTATADRPGMAWAIPEQIAADVAAARRLADHVVVQLHSGYEYVPAPSEEQKAAARAAIDAGAALVIGHHAHILQGIEFYNGGVIAYGLGNFAFTIDGPPETGLLHVWLDQDGVRAVELVPGMVQESGQPRPATPEEAEMIRGRLYSLTNSLNPR